MAAAGRWEKSGGIRSGFCWNGHHCHLHDRCTMPTCTCPDHTAQPTLTPEHEMTGAPSR